MNAHYCSLNHCINCGGCISSPFVKCEECRSVPTLTPSSTTDYSRKQDILLRTFVEENKALKEKLKEAKEIIGYFVDNSPTSIIRFSEFEKRAEKFIEDLKVDQGEIKCILTLKELEKPHQVKNYLFIQLMGKIC